MPSIPWLKWLPITPNCIQIYRIMFSALGLPRSFLVYGLCVPIAVFLGYLLATPLEFTSYELVALFLLALTIPLWLRWHYPLLLFAWNAWIIVFFLPGQPGLGVTLAATSLCIVMLNRTVKAQ